MNRVGSLGKKGSVEGLVSGRLQEDEGQENGCHKAKTNGLLRKTGLDAAGPFWHTPAALLPPLSNAFSAPSLPGGTFPLVLSSKGSLP